jgi:hypothetical protein
MTLVNTLRMDRPQPIRDYLFTALQREYGEPAANPSSDWWTIGARRPFPVHITLNQPTRTDEAHVLIYDPNQTEGVAVIEARAGTLEEADVLCRRIRRIVDVNNAGRPRH